MRNSIAEEQCTFLTTVVGATSFIRAVGIPLTEALEAELPKLGIRHHRAKLDDIFTVDTGLKADVTGIVGIVGVLFFVGSWAATKLLDEIYSKVRPKLADIFRHADKQLPGPYAPRKKVYQLGTWYAAERVFILIAIVGDSFEEIMEHEALVPAVHASAISWIDQNGKHKPVHLYLMEKGRSNVAPLLFDYRYQAQRHITDQWRGGPPGTTPR